MPAPNSANASLANDNTFTFAQALVSPNQPTTPKGVRGIYVGVGGNLSCRLGDTASDANVVFSNILVGNIYFMNVQSIDWANTTASGIVVLY